MQNPPAYVIIKFQGENPPVEELYELYAFFAPRSNGEFVYNDKFIVNADFRYEEAD